MPQQQGGFFFSLDVLFWHIQVNNANLSYGSFNVISLKNPQQMLSKKIAYTEVERFLRSVT